MSQFELNVVNRTTTGKEASKASRRGGEIPAVLYGHKETPKAFTVSTKDFTDAIAHHGTKSLVVLKGDGANETAFIKSIQRNYAKGTFFSVDFIRVSRDEKITVSVPVVLDGESIDVKTGDGILVQGSMEIQITAPADQIPDAVHVDVSKLELDGPAIHAGEIELPKGVELAAGQDDDSIAAVNLPEREEEIVAEPVADATGSEATAQASGETPAT
jgi:large subunit ribosomal protein L25